MNWADLLPKALKPRGNRGRILLWSCLAALIFGIIGLGQPLENSFRDTRNIMRLQSVSGDITLVTIDDRSASKLGRWPWARRHHGQLVDQLQRMGAKRVYFDIVFAAPSDAENDQAFEDSLKRAGRKVILPVYTIDTAVTDGSSEHYPLARFGQHTSQGHITLNFDAFGAVRSIPYTLHMKEGVYPAFAVQLADRGYRDGEFLVDYSLDPASIPTVSAIDVINGTAPIDRIRGKDVIIGTTAWSMGDTFVAPGHGIVTGVYLHVLAAETLKQGFPVNIPWIVPLLLALLVAASCVLAQRRTLSVVAMSAAIVLSIALPFVLEPRLVYAEVVPALFLLLLVAGSLSWGAIRESYRARAVTNPVSGLPNLNALKLHKVESGAALVAGRVHNYAAIAATLSAEGEKALVEQIEKRLLVQNNNVALYQGDEGIFAWFVPPGRTGSIGVHLDALHSLFRSPVLFQGHQFDLVITFGFDCDQERAVSNRFASALVAADEAHVEGLKWKEHDPSRQQDTAWRLSLLSQLDAAIDMGDLWVAYQPKVELATGKIIGAEALARWTHPEKGAISPLEFILAAEQSNRIEKLTHHVLDQAVRVAAIIHLHHPKFNMSVNLSARLIDDRELAGRVGSILKKHGLPPECLTLEVTETAALGSSARNLEVLEQLRLMGVGVSVDDYGTGMSTLDYLQRIPATEIKIDRSFVVGMTENQATRVMVNSTIQLAHSLGLNVVAEGVEDQDTLEELRLMNCDAAQGFYLGRPMTSRGLAESIFREGAERAA
jgi:EAL domain-containing protein (putative c-di-GMP-specific phosphodiesterase class I)/CHASE2 domain-containing sensor protein